MPLATCFPESPKHEADKKKTKRK